VYHLVLSSPPITPADIIVNVTYRFTVGDPGGITWGAFNVIPTTDIAVLFLDASHVSIDAAFYITVVDNS
jgi:hypothetical protein